MKLLILGTEPFISILRARSRCPIMFNELMAALLVDSYLSIHSGFSVGPQCRAYCYTELLIDLI